MRLIKNPDYQFTMPGNDRPFEFTCYRAKSEARRQIHEAYNPCLISISGQDADGVERVWYDSYPLGHPVPKGPVTVYYNDEGGTVHAHAAIIERCVLTTAGMRWKGVR